MKYLFIASIFAISTTYVSSAEQITSLSPSSRSEIELFNKAGAAQSVKTIPASEISFPVTVQANESGFLKVNVEGKGYWLKSTQVRIQRDVVASCAAAAERAERVGATPGLAGNSCK